MSDILENTGGGGAWDAEGKSFFYTLQDENHRPSKIFHHILGQPQSADRLVYEETDPGMFMGVGGSRLDDFIFIDVHDHDTTEYRLLSTKDLLAEPKLVVAREPGMQYELAEGGDRFFILTNCDGAKDFKIMEAPVESPPRRTGANSCHMKPAASSSTTWPLCVTSSGWNAATACRACHPRPQERRRTRDCFDEEAYSLGLSGAAEYDTDVIRFSYSSMTTPSQVFDYNMATRERTLLKTQESPPATIRTTTSPDASRPFA